MSLHNFWQHFEHSTTAFNLTKHKKFNFSYECADGIEFMQILVMMYSTQHKFKYTRHQQIAVNYLFVIRLSKKRMMYGAGSIFRSVLFSLNRISPEYYCSNLNFRL